MGRTPPASASPWAWVAVLAVTLAAVSTAPATADEQTERPPEDAQDGAPLPDGAWVGTISMEGDMAADLQGTSATGRLNVSGPVEAETADGAVTGEGELAGTGRIRFTGQLDALLDFDIDMSTDVTGDQRQLTVEGTHTTGLEMQIFSPVRSTRSFGTNQHPLGPFTAEITGYDCHRVYADFTADLAAEAAEGGWQSTDLRGLLDLQQAGPEIDSGLRDEADELIADYNQWADEVRAGVHGDAEDPSTALTAPLRQQINDLVNRAVELELTARGQGEDDPCVFGEQAGAYSYLMTAMIQHLAAYVLNAHAGLTADDLAALGEILLATGGIGEGAARDDMAEELEGLLAARGSELLADHLVTDEAQSSQAGEPCSADAPCLDPTDEVVDVLLTSRRLGLTLQVAGEEVAPADADDLLADIEE